MNILSNSNMEMRGNHQDFGNMVTVVEPINTIFVDETQSDIKLLKHMTRRDCRLAREYRRLYTLLNGNKVQLSNINRKIHEEEENTLNMDYIIKKYTGTLPKNKYVDLAEYLEQSRFVNNIYELTYNVYDLERQKKRLETIKYSLIKKVFKIIHHFKERHFIEMRQEIDANTRTVVPENDIDLVYLENKLPAELVDIIGSYLPINIRIHMMEESSQFLTKVANIGAKKSHAYLFKLNRHISKFHMLTSDDITHHYVGQEHYNYRLEWLDAHNRTNMKERIQRIIYIYYKCRRCNEKAALLMLKEFAVLFKN